MPLSSVSSSCSLTRQRKSLCGDEVVLKPFGTDLNHCRYFQWVDDPIFECGKVVILEQKDKIGKMEKQIKYMREKAKSFEDKVKEYGEWGKENIDRFLLLVQGTEGKLYFYNTKRDKTKYVTLNDDNGVAMLFHLNEDDVDLFVEDTGQNNDPIQAFHNSTRESMVTDNISSPGGTLPLPSSNQVSQEMGLVSYLPQNANEILTEKGQLFDNPDLFKQLVLLFVTSNKFSFNYFDNSEAYYRLEVLGGCQVVLVTDRNTSLLNGIINVFGGDCNAWCLRHLKENFNKFASSNRLKAERWNMALKVVNDLAYVRTEDSFKYHLGKLYGISPDLSKWVEHNNPKHWSNAFFPYKRWDKMYINLTECFNSWILPLRELDIIQFMTGHVSKTTELLLHKHTEVRKRNWPVGKEIENDIKKSQEYARKFTHRNSSPTEFTVANDTSQLYEVKLIPRTCSCLAW
ncbi:hypothetical protein RHMOL_Rhmol01G0144400 [Rhododendron molle]|uniref:Uncharacterized protein n=1 Tax=Rhododendron molle TaxID=49168 RepID=A0ACC0Q455_RHOML|nr:hypothetical protein RHMOL_Rhmol01G0144400 [Rhododendron molle]